MEARGEVSQRGAPAGHQSLFGLGVLDQHMQKALPREESLFADQNAPVEAGFGGRVRDQSWRHQRRNPEGLSLLGKRADFLEQVAAFFAGACEVYEAQLVRAPFA